MRDDFCIMFHIFGDFSTFSICWGDRVVLFISFLMVLFLSPKNNLVS